MSEGVVTISMTNARPARATFIRGTLRSRIEEQLRDALRPWGLPLHRYRFTAERNSVPDYQDHHGRWQGWHEDIPVSATFTHRRTGAQIAITEIWLGADGEILQYATQYGALTL